MLAFETRAGQAVGVAISVTTIPAAALAGVAIALGSDSRALGSLKVLGTNVAMLLIGGTITLAIQKLVRRHTNRNQCNRRHQKRDQRLVQERRPGGREVRNGVTVKTRLIPATPAATRGRTSTVVAISPHSPKLISA